VSLRRRFRHFQDPTKLDAKGSRTDQIQKLKQLGFLIAPFAFNAFSSVSNLPLLSASG